MQRVLKRLAVIESLLTLSETEDLPKHLDRLAAEPLADPRLAAVLAALRAHRYAEGTRCCTPSWPPTRRCAVGKTRSWRPYCSKSAASKRSCWPSKPSAPKPTACSWPSSYGISTSWASRCKTCLALRRDVARYHRQESAYLESEYQRAQQRYQQQTHDREQAQTTAAHTFALDADGRATLKKLYREAAQLCHPDRVAEAHKDAATAVFQHVLSAYQCQDVAALQTQLLDLRRGIFMAATPTSNSIAVVQARRDALTAKHAALLQELAELRASEAFALAQADETTRDTYLATNRAALLAERDRLQKQYAQLTRQAEAAA